MADLPETSEWTAGIYQLETSDPVLGGPEGIDNLQAKQLANRTAWLKQQAEAAQAGLGAHEAAADPHPQYLTAPEGDAKIAAAVAALVNSSPATLDTLAELAASLGNDPNFATTLTALLGLKAPLASPTFTGDPKAPTPAQFDNDTSLATSEFVKRAGLLFGGQSVFTASGNITAAMAGRVIFINSPGLTLTLPSPATVPVGDGFYLVANAASATIACSIGVFTNYGAQTSILLADGDTLWLASDGANWNVTSRGGKCFKNFSANGYQKLPGGLIEQWVVGNSDGNGNLTLTLPIQFPTAVLGGVANEGAPGGWVANSVTVWGFDLSASTLSTAVARVRNIVGAGGPAVANGISGRIRVWGY